MPNRMIKESAFTSERISSLSDFQFRLWVGLITQADDAGRGDARPAIIKGRVFALRERVTVKDVDAALCVLAAAGCVSLYKVGGKPYYAFPNWAEHQRIRNCIPKYPSPNDGEMTDFAELPQSAASCGELPQSAALIQSESNTNPNPNPKENLRAREDDFGAFWDAYPRHVGKDKAKLAFAKVKVPVSVLIDAIRKQKNSSQWQEDGGKYIPYPTTWLNRCGWEDELPEAKGGQKNVYGCGELGEAEMEAIRRTMAEPAFEVPWQDWEEKG